MATDKKINVSFGLNANGTARKMSTWSRLAINWAICPKVSPTLFTSCWNELSSFPMSPWLKKRNRALKNCPMVSVSKCTSTSYLMRSWANWASTPAKPFNRITPPKNRNTIRSVNSLPINESRICDKCQVILLALSPVRSSKKSVIGATATTDNAFRKACIKTNPKSSKKCPGKRRNRSAKSFSTIFKILC